MALGVVACSDSAGPVDSEVIELFPTEIGTTWVYVSRDTLISGAPKTTSSPLLRYTVRHTRDTTLLGSTWHVLDPGALPFENQVVGEVILRNAPDGLRTYSAFLLRERVAMPAPASVGAKAGSWTVRALNERIETPAGVFFAVRYELTASLPPPPGAEPVMRWVVPGIGIVRNLHSTITEYDTQGIEVRRRQAILDLESFSRP